jgi:hypothetical protein
MIIFDHHETRVTGGNEPMVRLNEEKETGQVKGKLFK